MLRRTSLLRAIAPVLLSLSVTGAAFAADPSSEETARKLYDTAKKEMLKSDFGQACPRLEEAKGLLPDHINTGILLSECYVGAGKTASAWKELERVKGLAESQHKKDKGADITQRMTDLGPRVPKLKIVVPSDVAALSGLAVTLDGAAVSSSSWGNAEPVDPGAHEIVVSASDRKPWTTNAEINAEGGEVVVNVEAPASLTSETPKDDKPAPAAWRRPVAFAGMAAGALGLGLGAVFGGLAISKNSASDDGHCNAENRCDQMGYDLRNDARTFGNVSTAMWITGGVLLAGGVTLFILSPAAPKSKDAEPSQPAARVEVSPGGMRVVGRF